MKIYKCNICGKVVTVLTDSDSELVCCGKKMTEMKVNTVDASKEKHVPIYEYKDNILTVTVGEAIHPMEEAHHIEWIAVVQKGKVQRQFLEVDSEPTATFYLDNIDDVVLYEYCNLHGLWSAEVTK